MPAAPSGLVMFRGSKSGGRFDTVMFVPLPQMQSASKVLGWE